jgi:hypothetical protein
MGLEDREWRREELRQQGHKASWDNFRAGGPPPQPAKQHPSDVERIERSVKSRTPPSYVHLQAQEILDSRSVRSSYFWPVTVCASVFAVALGYAYFLL